MKNFLKNHQEVFLIAAAILLVGIVIAFWVWGITEITVGLNKTVSPATSEKSIKTFDFEGAKNLGLDNL